MTYLCQEFGSIKSQSLLDIKIQGTVTRLLHIVDLNTILLTGFDLHLRSGALDALATPPDVDECIAINDQAQTVVATNVEKKVIVGLRYEGGIEPGRAVLQIHTRCKDGVTTIAEADGLTGIKHGNGLTLHVDIVPVGNLHSAIAKRIIEQSEATLKHLIPGEGAAWYILSLRHIATDAVECSNGMGGIAGIIAPHHDGVVSIGTHHHDIGS